MSDPPPSSLDKWRDYFRSINTDIFNIIEHAIMIASKDYPYDFKLKRDRIAEVLFACKVTKCIGCEKIELAVPDCDDHDEDEGLKKESADAFKKSIDVDAVGTKNSMKESKRNCNKSRENEHRGEVEMMKNHSSMFSYGDAEALTDEIDEESQFFSEVLRIKDTIDKSEDMSDKELFDSLRRLELMPLSVETLKASEIGKSVNCLRRHGSKEIRNLAKKLIADWKVMVDEWVSATQAITEAELGSAQKTPHRDDEEEEGLPSPPLDEGAFFATPSSMELSQFFDGMDDDLNFEFCEELEKSLESVKERTQEKADTRTRKIESPDSSFARPKDKKPEPKRNQEPMLKKQVASSSKPNNARPMATRDEPITQRPKPVLQPKEIKVQQKPMAPPQREKLNYDNEASVQMKLEVAKRKLQERYQEAEKAKKQRTIQVVELHDIPKQSLGPKNSNQHTRSNGGGNNRFRANGRR